MAKARIAQIFFLLLITYTVESQGLSASEYVLISSVLHGPARSGAICVGPISVSLFPDLGPKQDADHSSKCFTSKPREDLVELVLKVYVVVEQVGLGFTVKLWNISQWISLPRFGNEHR